MTPRVTVQVQKGGRAWGRGATEHSRRKAMLFLLAIACISLLERGASLLHAGEIRGTVRYAFDRARPWRYSRYYVRQGKSGELAEAVVCLARRGGRLPEGNNTSPTSKPRKWIMDQKNFDFTPEILAIRAGDEVRFTNSDTQPHNVFTQWRDWGFNVTMPAGGAHGQIFARAGNHVAPLRIGCHLHGQMRAWIYVFDHPYYHLTGDDGTFSLRDVPAGEYELVVTHPAGNLSSTRSVSLRADESLIADFELTPDNEWRKSVEK